MSDKHIWTAGDWQRAAQEAMRRDDKAAWLTLIGHHLYADHCGGWEVLAWPCPTAAKMLDRLLGGDQ